MPALDLDEYTAVLVVWRNRSLEARPNARAYETLFTPEDPAQPMSFTIRYIAATKYANCNVTATDSTVFTDLDRSTAKDPALIPISLAFNVLGWQTTARTIDITDSEALLPPHPSGAGINPDRPYAVA